MADSISDILASVTRPNTSISGHDDDQQRQQDLQLLSKAWVAERVAPELLPYPSKLMERVMVKIRAQIEHIEDATARMDAGSSFGLIVIQTELERFKFLVRSYLRTRIAKIDAHPLYILAQHDPSFSPESQMQRQDQLDPEKPLLSPSEAHYAATHAGLLERHYNSLFLSSFPAKLRRLDDRAGAGGVGMVEGPDLDSAVFVRCLGQWRGKNAASTSHAPSGFDQEDESMDGISGDGRYAPVEVSCGYTAPIPDQDGDNADGTQQSIYSEERRELMRRGEIWIVRWRSVREAVTRGECELI